MRILAITPTYPPRLGGGEKYAHRTNSALVKHGAEVGTLTWVRGQRGNTTVDGVDVHYAAAPVFIGFPWFSIPSLLRAYHQRRPDVVLVYGPSPYDPICALAFRLLRCPYVQVYHADFNDRRPVTRFVTWAHNHIALRTAAAIICTNERMAQSLRRRGFGDRVVVVTPGVDERFFEAQAPASGDILFVAALDDGHRYKRLDLLLEAVASMKRDGDRRQVTVVGDGNRRPEFERLASALQVAEDVKFVGALEDDALAARYASAGVFVLPSPTAQEGFGLVCLEAMAAGAPVVCSVNAGAARVVAQAPGCATWDGQNIKSLISAIKKAASASSEQRHALRQYARRFAWDEMGRQLLERIGAAVAKQGST